MRLQLAVDSNVLITQDIYNPLYPKQEWWGISKKKKKGQVSLRIFRFSLGNIILAMLHTRLHLHTALTRRTNERNMGVFKKAMLFRKSGSTG